MVCLAIYIRTLACDRQTGRRTDRQTDHIIYHIMSTAMAYTVLVQRLVVKAVGGIVCD